MAKVIKFKSRYLTKAEALEAFNSHVGRAIGLMPGKDKEYKQRLLKVTWVEYISRLRDDKVISKDSLRWKNPFV